MNARIVKTAFYSDPTVENLSKDSKWLFMYFLTCPYIGLTGAFQVTESRIAYETGMTRQELTAAKEELLKFNRIACYESWIVVFNTEKHNRYSEGKKTGVAYQNEFENLPPKVKELLKSDTLSPF
jgi:hypothetical protein